jgi:hypothetical protein
VQQDLGSIGIQIALQPVDPADFGSRIQMPGLAALGLARLGT